MEATVQVHCALFTSDLNSLQSSPIPVSASCHPRAVIRTLADSQSILSTSVYRKPTHTDRYIPFNSHHHPRVLTGVMRGMRNRALQVCDDTSRPAEMQHLEEVFTANGFPEQLVKKTLS